MLTLQKYLRNVQRNLGQSCALRKTDHSMSQMANLQAGDKVAFLQAKNERG